MVKALFSQRAGVTEMDKDGTQSEIVSLDRSCAADFVVGKEIYEEHQALLSISTRCRSIIFKEGFTPGPIPRKSRLGKAE